MCSYQIAFFYKVLRLNNLIVIKSRLIFACAGVDFIDNRIKMDDWPALKNRDTFLVLVFAAAL